MKARIWHGCAPTFVMALALGAGAAFAAGETTVARLASETHFHGIAADPKDSSRFYLATHNGFFSVTLDGAARQVSGSRDDFMGFTPHPTDPAILYASGHPAGGGNLGFMASTDGGRSWTKLSNGAGGPVDFHQMDVSKADPKVIYGVYGGLQKSVDAGRNWVRVGPAPEGTIAIAASAKSADALYAATQNGILKSVDGGKQWAMAYPARRTATMAHVTANGTVYAFLVGMGLLSVAEPGVGWKTVSESFGNSVIIHLAAAPSDPKALFAVLYDTGTRRQSVLASRDGGATWAPLGK